MNALRTVLGVAWASPLTLAGYLVALLTGTTPTYYLGATAVCRASWLMVWFLGGPIGRFFVGGSTNGIGAFAWGDVIVVREPWLRDGSLLAHELEHVRQARAMGIAFPLIYVGAGVFKLVQVQPFAWRNWYQLNPFEVAAREVATYECWTTPACATCNRSGDCLRWRLAP